MIVGTGISALIEEPDKALKFDLEEMKSDEAYWYLGLTKLKDEVGSPDSISTLQEAQSVRTEPTGPKFSTKSKPSRQGTSKIVAIEEIKDSDEEEDDDLIPYEKPDDDTYDSDEDPTLIQRNKPTAPV